jgi:hypothetical protein
MWLAEQKVPKENQEGGWPTRWGTSRGLHVHRFCCFLHCLVPMSQKVLIRTDFFICSTRATMWKAALPTILPVEKGDWTSSQLDRKIQCRKPWTGTTRLQQVQMHLGLGPFKEAWDGATMSRWLKLPCRANLPMQERRTKRSTVYTYTSRSTKSNNQSRRTSSEEWLWTS